jgi:hypothetical protein
MPEIEQPEKEIQESDTEIRLHAQALERELAELRERSHQRLIRAELKAEAIKAGMVDLDGLKLIDPSGLKLTDSGEVEGALETMQRLKAAKPWLFIGASSSSPVQPPPAQPPRQKLATEMSDAEYQAARAALLKQYSSFG